MPQFIAEFIGTMLLMLLGNGVVATVLLKKSKGENSGWIVITLGWGMAVFVGVLVAGKTSGAHLNPAVSLGLAFAHRFAWKLVPMYITAQILGAMTGQFLVYGMFYPHYKVTEDKRFRLLTFCTDPEIYCKWANFLSEVLGTFVLIFAVLMTQGVIMTEHFGEISTSFPIDMGALGALPISLVVVAIGLSLGATTGYAINPARDFGPRLVHAFLSIKNAESSNWYYAWIPIAGPITGAFIAAMVFIVIIAHGVI